MQEMDWERCLEMMLMMLFFGIKSRIVRSCLGVLFFRMILRILPLCRIIIDFSRDLFHDMLEGSKIPEVVVTLLDRSCVFLAQLLRHKEHWSHDVINDLLRTISGFRHISYYR